MSEPQYIVLPIQGQNGQPLQSNGTINVSSNDQLQEQMAQIAQTIQRNNEVTKQREDQEKQATGEKQAAEHPSLVKQITSDPSVLYSFINWENPGRTLASLITMMSLIISTRYFSPVQWILKIFCIVLGGTSLLEMVGRAATKDGIISRVRPQSYYRPSERTYSRLFSELGEAGDMISVKLQEIIFAENLRGTSIAFALSFIAYWLLKAIPPFWLAITATLLTYTLGPILTRQHSDHSLPSMKPVIDQKAQDLKNSAVGTASLATNRAANTARDLSSQAVDTASSATDRVAGTVQDLNNSIVATASDLTATKTQNLDNRSMGTTAHSTDYVRGLETRSTDTAYSATDHIGSMDHGVGGQHVSDYGSTA